ncbi:urea ABC transporter ATP-binding subunit UrtE [Alisedimentitalea sp. MJ-SS2]|uniref:urea ABC transporter ATP-binding subunit UrtE n=1 Tax=Aliisedimentitalea sp. MJ-SS2 TaxID=3049795 RepID=UPI00290E8424|nr:urea ABC transporter ATP-binding subunit UrtE [Alisedimentitalea sp. MJ-SS2]MDU8928078.1 urea ABC transporter ATP-binding subunit UrtE [Alisedimentitalea sp. MJ-SS2]
MLKLRDLTLHYGHSQILNGISMEASLGEVTCVMGTNGVGKTSLIKAISGTHPRSGGDVILNGEPLGVLPAHRLAHKGVAYVPQGREIFPLLTVRENLETGFVCLPPDAHFIPDEVFDLFPVLKEMLNRRGGDLSGGQQQQLAIARALITKPRLLLLDEPTEGIQPNIISQIGEVIRHLRAQGKMAIVLVEQYFEFAYDLADRFVVLRRGEVLVAGQKNKLKKEDVLEGVSV